KIAELLQNVPKPLPNNLKNFADEMEALLGDAAARAVRLMVWFCGSSSGHDSIGRSKALAYSIDGNDWRRLSRTLGFQVRVGFAELIISDAVVASVADLWRHGGE